MKWLLIVIVMHSPLKTGLVFNKLDDCLVGEQEMRTQWAEIYNHAVDKKATKESLNMIRSQMTNGTCIPIK